MVALATIVMFGIVGLAVDVGRLYVTRVELGRSLDVSALSGILELNGQPSGLANAETKAQQYFAENEENATATVIACDGDPGPPCYGESNTLTMNATKSINMIFLSVLGIKTASVSAHAKAGFGTQYLDAALVLDSTGSMAGNPINQAKIATENFKNILLGSSPTGNVGVGFTPFRGCYRANSPSATAPWPSSQANCVYENTQVTGLGSNSALLTSRISAIDATGGSGTNICTGISKGWEILEGSGNHMAEEGNRRFMIVLSDGDNNYNGSYTYMQSPRVSPHSYQSHDCRPPASCTTNPYSVGNSTSSAAPGECANSLNTSAAGEITDQMPSGGCNVQSYRRERQMDMLTIEMAQAVKTDGIEIFVVRLGGCANNATVYTAAQCKTAFYGGQVGNTDKDDIADQRLMKCVASSSTGGNDHYYYTNDANDLPGIFTSIANQISHRLIE